MARRVDGAPFAGRWVLNELHRSGTDGWRPGLRILQRFGVLEKVGASTRGGDRAYYRMPDPEGVDQALRRLGH
ncbi:MAG: hypothetical protein ACYDCB_11860 [Candidatus Dormibacteria bacterium]